MSILAFHLVEGPDSEPPEDYDENVCSCPPGDTQYLLEINEGQASLIHAACKKEPPASWGDWHDLVQMDQMPVTARWETDCDGNSWHGMNPCDCDHWVVLTPAATEPPKAPAQAEKNVVEARRAVHEALVLLPAWEADRVRHLLADLETAVESRTALRLANAEKKFLSAENGVCTNCGATPNRWCEYCASCPDGCYGGHKRIEPCPEAP